MRDVENVGERRLVDCAAVDRPEPAENAEEGGLAASVGPDDKQVIALLERERECLNKDIAIGGNNRAVYVLVKERELRPEGDLHVDELNVFALNHFAPAL